MQSLASSIVASLVLSVLLFANPTEAACSTVALINKGNAGANYVTAAGVAHGDAGGGCATSDTVRATCTATIADGKFCATDCDKGVITAVAGGVAGTVGADTVLTAFTPLTPDTKFVSTAGVVGTNNHGDCNAVGTQLLQTAWANIPANQFVSTAGVPGDFTTVGNINQMTAFTTAIAANKYFKTAGAVGTKTTAGSDVVTAPFTTLVPTGKYASTKGVIGAVVAAGTFTTAGSDVQFTACSTCTAFQSLTTACVKGVPTAAGGWAVADAGKDTVCSSDWATCASTDGSAATLSSCKCGTTGCATGKFCTSASNSCAATATAATGGAAGVTLSTAAFVVAAFAALPLRN